MFKKLPVNEVHFVIAHYCIAIILKTKKKYTADIGYVNIKFQIFISGVVRESLVEKEQLVRIL